MGLMAAGMLSCSSILDEQPRATFDPSFFTTQKGIEGGLTSLYAHTRYFYGQYFYAYQENGTDEYTWAQSADGNFKDNDYDKSGNINSNSCRADALWGTCFANINTASGIIENAEAVNLSPALTAEAYFFRAFDYFMLVQAYGGVPLDLGAGELKFNSSPARASVRNTVAEVYEKAIIPDLVKAANDLPDTPRKTGALCKTTANFFLAKAYLTYAWWLENPKGIATYPECSRNSGEAKSYFEKALATAKLAIANPGPFKLMPTYYDLHLGANDHNNTEYMLYADHTETSEEYDAQNHGYAGGSAPDNFCVWFATCNYTTAKSIDGVPAVNREAAQGYGRPWTRMAPIHEVFSKRFTDRDKDSRADATFVLCYRGNWNRAGKPNAEVEAANGMKIKQDDAFFTFDDVDADYSAKKANGVGAGEVPGRSDFVISLKNYNRKFYPGLWKLGTYRTDNNGGMGSPNGAITRPFVIAKFSELYLIAAEAAVKLGDKAEARQQLNVLRARAGKWSFTVAGNKAVNLDYSKELTDATPSGDALTVDYVLDERMRELFGECMRRYDLIRTQTWEERATTYTQCGTSDWDHTPTVETRKIQSYNWLSPIPQGQIDGLVMDAAAVKAYQNPGY